MENWECYLLWFTISLLYQKIINLESRKSFDMTKKTLAILTSSLTGVSAVGAVSGVVVSSRMINRNIDK